MSPNETEYLSKNALIAKLEEIFGLYTNVVAIQSQIENFKPEDNYEREIVIPQFPGDFKKVGERELWATEIDHASPDALKIVKEAHRRLYGPKEPKKPKIDDFCEPTGSMSDTKNKMGCLSLCAGFVAFIALGALPGADGLGKTVSWILLTLSAAGFVTAYIKITDAKKKDQEKKQQALAEYENQKQEEIEKYNANMVAYKKAKDAYETILQEFLNKYSEWRKVYIASVQEEAHIAEKLEADRIAGRNKIYAELYIPAKNNLDSQNNLVSKEHLPVLNVIIDLLKSGRADSLKEAINLYEEIMYRERQLKLQREAEEQRRYEEELRREDDERRHREEMRFREEQERQRRFEEDQRRRDEERRHREEMNQLVQQERNRQYEERRRREEDQRRADKAALEKKREEERSTSSQCQSCALTSRCSMAFRRPNCASWRPR